MNIELLIAFYMFVCLAMILFNLLFLLSERQQMRQIVRREREYAGQFSQLVDDGSLLTQEGAHRLEKTLKHLPGMEAFDLALAKFDSTNSQQCREYLIHVSPSLERLALWYGRRSELKRAYYAYILGRWYPVRPAKPSVTSFLLRNVAGDSIYLRQNAFTAISRVGSPREMVNAVEALRDSGDFHHPKLVTETLLVYGDRDALIKELVARFDELAPTSQAASVNFFRMAATDDTDSYFARYGRRFLRRLMEDEETDEEVRIACIRFFTRHPWSEVADCLRSFAQKDGVSEWEYAAVAATALSHYPGELTVNVLKGCLFSREWYVRRNAAKSLCDLGLELEELRDVLEGPDRYARDAVIYRWAEDRGVHWQGEVVSQ